MRCYQSLLFLLVLTGCLSLLAPAFGQKAAPQSTAKRVILLIQKKKSLNPATRRDAAFAPGQFFPSAVSAIPALTAALKDKDMDVREAAAEALKKIRQSQKDKPTP